MKIKNDLTNWILLVFPLIVATFMVTEGVIWKLVTGHSMLGIDPAVGAMIMVVSMLTIPFAILRGGAKS